jgi:hypothetical protein
MKKLIALAIPILPGKTEQFNKFISTLNGDKHDEFKASRETLDVYERTFLQETPNGDSVIVTLEGTDPEAALAKLGTGKDAFTKWFVKEVKEIHGVDLSAPMEGFSTELVADSKTLVHELA